MGFIGMGGIGTHLLRSFLRHEETQVVAVCDVDRERRRRASRIVQEFYAAGAATGRYRGCADYNDFQDVIARNDIDALCIALPDHWHAIPVIEGAKVGKDIYAEKPLGLTVQEGRMMSDIVRRYGRVFQTGSQLRSRRDVRHGCELVRNGRLGEIHTVHVVCGEGRSLGLQPKTPVPDGFDYDRWLGPAPWAPYTQLRCHGAFRFIFDYSGGEITDHGAHYCDLDQWGLGMERSGPTEFDGYGEIPDNGLFNTAMRYRVECTYANGIRLFCTHERRVGTTFHGSEGSIFVGDEVLESDPPHLAHSRIGPSEIQLYKSHDHHQNFLDCVRSRKDPVASIEEAHRSVTIGHIANIAMQLGRKLLWNPKTERFVDDLQADRLLSRSMRVPWHL